MLDCNKLKNRQTQTPESIISLLFGGLIYYLIMVFSFCDIRNVKQTKKEVYLTRVLQLFFFFYIFSGFQMTCSTYKFCLPNMKKEFEVFSTIWLTNHSFRHSQLFVFIYFMIYKVIVVLVINCLSLFKSIYLYWVQGFSS